MTHTSLVRLRDKTAEDLRAYLAQTATRWNLKEWQYIQLVEALRVLFSKIVKPDWADGSLWGKWKEPHLNFPDKLEHYGGLPERTEWQPPASDADRFKDSPKGLKAFDLFKNDFEKLRIAILVRHYSIRTEQAYED